MKKNALQVYLEKRTYAPQQIECLPNRDLKTIITIPCFNEPTVLKTLESLVACKSTLGSVEVIVVVNSGITTSEDIISFNRETYNAILEFAAKNNCPKLKFFPLLFENLPRKKAGVGLARKIAMDEAVRRFSIVENSRGVIVGFDADSICEPSYLFEIERFFDANTRANGCTIRFEHPLEMNGIADDSHKAIILYELYLRYYASLMRVSGFPHCQYTVGSSFAVCANIYAQQGGMNTRKAGEDFYFLHKVFPIGGFEPLNTTCVIPASRPSDRVPFGTGAALRKMLATEINYMVYNPRAFFHIRKFIRQIPRLYENQNPEEIFSDISPYLFDYLMINGLQNAIDDAKKNSSNKKNFIRRFFVWFDAFRYFKFLNDSHIDYYKKIPVEKAARIALRYISNCKTDIKSPHELLIHFRHSDKTSDF